MADDTTTSNYTLFRECFSSTLLERLARPEKRKSKKRGERKSTADKDLGSQNENKEDLMQADQAELGEFIEFLATEIFENLPTSLQHLSNRSSSKEETKTEDSLWTTSLTSADVEEQIEPLLPSTVSDSISTYSLLPGSTSLTGLLHSTLEAYIASATAPAPVWSATRAEVDGCEICGRDWIPLTYHHLIPRSVHAKVLKRGWHDERELNSVAWLCRACHSFVHRCESNETLARYFYTVDKLTEREDVQSWARWVGRVRWKAR